MRIYKVTKIDEKNDITKNTLIIATSKRAIPQAIKENAIIVRDVTPSIEEIKKRLVNNPEFSDIEIDYIIQAIKHSDNKKGL